MLKLESHLRLNEDSIQAPNLLSHFDEVDQQAIASRVWEGYQSDKASRAIWERRIDASMKLALQVQEQKTFPWPGASNVIFPLVTIAALQFASEAYPNIIQGVNVVRYRAASPSDQVAQQRARRIGKHMSWQVLEQDMGWEEQHDRMLINLAITGCNFIKSYYSSSRKCPVSELVIAQDLVMDYGARSVEDAARKTHVLMMHRNEIWERCARGLFSDIRDEAWFKGAAQLPTEGYEKDRRQGVMVTGYDDDSRFMVLEQHCFLDLDGDGYEEPYIATIEHASKRILRLVSRIDDVEQMEIDKSGRIIRLKPTEYFTKYSFIPSADNGIYDDGFGKLLGPINEAVNSGINQLLDNGTMQNSIGGFLGRGAKIRGGVYTMVPWEWKRVDSTGDDLRKNMVPYPDRQPSAVMFSMLSLLIQYSDRLAGTTDPMVGENPGQNTPASTFQGMQEQGRKVYRWIFKRVWRSMKEEFKLRYALNSRFTDFRESFGEGDDFIRAEDYRGSPDQVSPVANPNITSSMMRIQQAMLVKQDAMATPGYDIPAVTRNFLHAIEIENPDILYPGPDHVPPLPNPKAQAEQQKIQARMQEQQAKLQYEKWKFLAELHAESQKTAAEIGKLRAETAQIIQQVGIDKAALQLQLFEKVIDALVAHHEILNQQIEAMQGEQDGKGSDGGGMEGMGSAPGNGGAGAGALQLGGGAQGAMGGPAVPNGAGGGNSPSQLGGAR